MPTLPKSKSIYILFAVAILILAVAGTIAFWFIGSRHADAPTTTKKVVMTTAPVLAMPGLVTSLSGNSFILAPYNAASFDPSLPKRTVLIDPNATFQLKGAKKDSKVYSTEVTAYLEKVKSANAGDAAAKKYIDTNPYPGMYAYHTVSSTTLEVGDSVTVLTTSDVRQSPQFTTTGVLIEATSSIKFKQGTSMGVGISIATPTVIQKVASLFSVFGFAKTAHAQSAPTIHQGKLHWTGVWTANQFSCDAGYALKKFHFVENDSNNAMWYGCYGYDLPTAVITASPASVVAGSPTTLNWSSTFATSCTGTNFNTGNATSGSVTVTPGTTTVYAVSCTGGGGSATAIVTVAVTMSAQPNLTATLVSGQTNLAATVGTPITLSATVANVGSASTGTSFPTVFWTNTSQSQSGGSAQYTDFTSGVPNGFPANYSEIDGPQLPVTRTFGTPGTYYYQVCADQDHLGNHPIGSLGNNYCSAWGTITVTALAAPTATLSASPASVTTGTPSTLTWTSTHATSCSINNAVGAATPVAGGSVSVTPASTTTYTITCTGAGGTATATATVTVSGIADITAGATTPTSATTNVPVTLTSSVTNGGTASSGSFPSIFEINTASTVTGTNSVTLAAAGSAAVTATYTFTSPGTYQVRSCGNFNTSWVNIVTESNYGNNCGAWQTVIVTSIPPPTVSCTASPTTIPAGGSVTWTATPSGGTAPYSYTWGGNVSGTSQMVSQTYPSPGTYSGNVTVTDSKGIQSSATQCSPGGSSNPVTVTSCTPTFSANPSTVVQGANATLTWASNAGCNLSCSGVGFTATGGTGNGSAVVNPSAPSSSYSLMCTGQPNQNVTIPVTVPSVTLTATPPRVSSGGTTSLSWTSTYTTSCAVSRNGGSQIGIGVSGTAPDPTPITTQTTYTATCLTAGNPVHTTASVNVVPQFSNF